MITDGFLLAQPHVTIVKNEFKANKLEIDSKRRIFKFG